MYLNNVVLVGEIVSELRLREPDSDKPKTPVLDFRLRVLRRQWKRESMTIRVVVFGGGAWAFNDHKKQGDFVVISGRLCQTKFPGKEGGTIEHHYVVAEEFRFLWGPPGKFVKGHVLVPRDQYERWRALEEEAGEFYVPKKVREKLLGGSGDSAFAANAEDDDRVEMPSGIWGYEPATFERERT